ncbi:hypothetical protein [Mariniplasma anaerobium]|uniref:Uncharacterized protein n=1 Tax=Mariniplasma anaerobium TaxID=2735436 RepID=A0A7U9THJ6_9MOLU|nr:hypothetical protein [Mariniplasma anaerobium]BCR36598.1 hypothetical protein MPAN_014910 [Mariniplasma anaerobium]
MRKEKMEELVIRMNINLSIRLNDKKSLYNNEEIELYNEPCMALHRAIYEFTRHELKINEFESKILENLMQWCNLFLSDYCDAYQIIDLIDNTLSNWLFVDKYLK